MKYALLFIPLFLLSCSLTNNDTPTQDELLKEQLLGQWDFTYMTVNYLPNNTFIDSFYYGQDFSTLQYVISGDYVIENGYVTPSNLSFVFIDTSLIGGSSSHMITFYPSKIILDEYGLISMGSEILIGNENSSNSIEGSWISTLSAIGINKDRNVFSGEIKREFNFQTDSSNYNLIESHNFDSPFSADIDSGNYTLNLSELDFTSKLGYEYRYTLVSFLNKKMYWDFKRWSYRGAREKWSSSDLRLQDRAPIVIETLQ